MTVEYVRKIIQQIEGMKDRDPEVAHALRDELAMNALRYIAKPVPGMAAVLTAEEASKIATEAIKAFDIHMKWEACA